jgi:hypothetical protein
LDEFIQVIGEVVPVSEDLLRRDVCQNALGELDVRDGRVWGGDVGNRPGAWGWIVLVFTLFLDFALC